MKSLRMLLVLASVLPACRTPNSNEASSAVKEAPTGDNSPHWWGLTTMRYDDLPMSFKLDHVPWASEFWPTYRGGISVRWQKPKTSKDYKKYLYDIPTAEQIAAMTDKQVNALSATEKYDIWMGRTDLASPDSATGRQREFMLNSAKFNLDQLGTDEIPGWTGICNGWSLAAINEPYPAKQVKVTAADGRKITFYSGDIQGLISQIYFDYQPSINVSRLGAMCDQAKPPKNDKGRIIRPSCRDVNPMSFHLALGRFLAKGNAFVFDFDPKEETWNQPVYSYKLEMGEVRPLDETYVHAAEGTTQLVDVRAELHYIVEAEVGKVGLTPAELKQFISQVTYRYTLELDDAGMILGGEWQKGSKLPDFLWKPDELPSDALLQGMDPSYPILYDKVKELITTSVAQP